MPANNYSLVIFLNVVSLPCIVQFYVILVANDAVKELLSTKKEPPECGCEPPRSEGAFIWGWGKLSSRRYQWRSSDDTRV